MDENKGIRRKLFQGISKFASKLDDKLRQGDFRLNRTAGGFLDSTFGICRHSYEYLVLPALIAGILIMGVPESGTRLYLSVSVFIAVLVILILLARLAIRRRFRVSTELLLQVAIVLGIAGIVWVTGGDTYQKGGGIYRHFFVLAAIVVCGALVVAGLLSDWIWSRLRIQKNYDKAITKTELFVSRDVQIPLGWGQLVRSFLTVIQGAPLQLLLLPSIFTLFAPSDLMLSIAIVTLIVSYGVLLMGGIDSRLNQMWCLVQSAFFRGGALLVSLIVIVLAATRLYGVTYVTTIFDTAERIVIALILFSAYVLFWWYDYWVNRLLAQELMKFLNSEAVCDAQIPYPIDAVYTKTNVLDKGRILQIHGASRFIVVGSSKEYPCCFQPYPFDKLFESLAITGLPGGKASPSPGQIAERIFDFKCLAGTFLAVLSVSVAVFIHWSVQKPQLEADNRSRPEVQLAQIVNQHSRDRDERPSLFIAASGGGTRAALYTAAVLEGLAERGQIQDVIMGSGVSGGGAALAYFAGKRTALAELQGNAWEIFFEKFKQPFIQDVLEGALEWRIVSSERLGVLLAESFKRRWELEQNRNELGMIKDFGLILNTAIAGRFACEDGSGECSRLPLVEAERRFRKQMTRSEMSGGRLILTNLALKRDFAPTVVETGGPEGLPVVVDDPKTRLEIAAALNANFPPVFSNAAIDVGGKYRYWVTDGGAVDNRGIEMLLYALQDILREPKEIMRNGRLPAITVVVVDASAFSNTYSQDRGIGTMMGAGTQYASLLVEEQLQSIRALYSQAGQSKRFRFVYLPMPQCLRESGSFGTHWMLQPNIKIDLGPHDNRSITGDEMVNLLRAMHSTKQHWKLSPDAQAILKHAVTDVRWSQSAKELGFIRE